MLYSLAKLTYDAEPLVDTLLDRLHHAVMDGQSIDSQAAANALWAMTVLQVLFPSNMSH